MVPKILVSARKWLWLLNPVTLVYFLPKPKPKPNDKTLQNKTKKETKIPLNGLIKAIMNKMGKQKISKYLGPRHNTKPTSLPQIE